MVDQAHEAADAADWLVRGSLDMVDVVVVEESEVRCSPARLRFVGDALVGWRDLLVGHCGV